jgi:membrane protein required for colicin V production
MSSIGISWVDIVIISIIGLSALISLFRGFVRETLSLISWILAFWVALTFAHPAAQMFLQKYIKSPTLQLAAAFGGLFLITLIICAVLNYFISTLVDKTGLSGTDRLLGVIFGLARGIVLVAALLLGAQLTPMPKEDWWQKSALISRFEPLEIWLKSFLPASMEEHFDKPAEKSSPEPDKKK